MPPNAGGATRQRRHGIGFIIVDYLQLLQGSSKSGDNRVQEISEISRGLKTLAKELHVPVMALSQLSRQVESREDKRPQLSDLRESGSIEQDADMVLFVFREDYYVAAREPKRPVEGDDIKIHAAHEEWAAEMERVFGLAEVIVAKSRHGSTGKIRLHFEAKTTKFSDLADLRRGTRVCSQNAGSFAGLSSIGVTASWMPHSVLSQPRQRPARGSSPGLTFEVQGEQPIEG